MDDDEEDNSAEIQYAEIENRLRGMIVELMQPTVYRCSLLQAEADNLKGLVNQHTKSINDVSLAQTKAQQQVSMIDSFREEMGKWDMQRKASETKVSEELSGLKTELDGFRYNLEQKESALLHLNRSVERTVSELNRIQESQGKLDESVELRLDECSKRLNRATIELETKLSAFELKHAALTDELWGEETGLAKVTGELHKTMSSVEKLEADMVWVQEHKAEQEDLQKVRVEVKDLVADAGANMAALKQTVGNVVCDIKEHLRTASETLAAHNATFVNEVRESYREELGKAAKLRSDTEAFVERVDKNLEFMEAKQSDDQTRTEQLVSEARSDIDTLNKKRKQDRGGFELEIKQLKKRLGGVFDNSDMVLKGMENMRSVLNILLEGERVQNALDVQDTIDRKKIALMGCKDDETTLVRSSHLTPQVPRPEHRHKSEDGYAVEPACAGSPAGSPRKAKGSPVVKVDTRCLSCSGQAPTVMTAFKMACLQYTPSQIPYQGKDFDRQEMLQHRRNLVQKAHEELAKGRRSQESEPTDEDLTLTQPSSPTETGIPSSDDGMKSPTMFALSEYAASAPWTYRKDDPKLPTLTKPGRTLVSPKIRPSLSPRKASDVR